MFENGYKSELAIKKWAKVLMYIAMALVILATIAAFVVYTIEPDYLWWLSLVIIAGGVFLAIPIIVSATLMYGFAEIVESNKAIANATQKEKIPVSKTLPEL